MDNHKLEVVMDYGKLSLNGYMYFRLTNWCGNVLYEIRGWKEDGEQPFDNDVKFTKAELKSLYPLLKVALNATKLKLPVHTMMKANSTVKIYNYFGDIESQGVARQLTYTDWGYGLKYDIRYWESDFSDCWAGVRLSEEECLSLIKILEKEFGFGGK